MENEVEQATAAPGETRRGAFRLKSDGPRYEVPTINGNPITTAHKVTIECEVGKVPQVTVVYHALGMDLDFPIADIETRDA